MIWVQAAAAATFLVLAAVAVGASHPGGRVAVRRLKVTIRAASAAATLALIFTVFSMAMFEICLTAAWLAGAGIAARMTDVAWKRIDRGQPRRMTGRGK